MWPLDVFCDPAWRPLTWALVYFLWQGMLVAVVWQALFRLFQSHSTQARYLLGLAGMLLMAACPVVTLTLSESEAGGTSARPSALSNPVMAMPDAPGVDPTHTIRVGATPNVSTIASNVATWRSAMVARIGEIQPYLLSGWIAGLMLFGGRLLAGVVGTRLLGRGRRPVSDEILARAAALARRMGFRAVPGVFGSATAREAVVVGLLRPMVLLPLAWMTEMTPEILEAVIALPQTRQSQWLSAIGKPPNGTVPQDRLYCSTPFRQGNSRENVGFLMRTLNF